MNNKILYLDGLRAISIIMVLLGHGANLPVWISFIANSHLGVMIFFSISGFLITTLLLKEKERNGKISLSGFYKRRILRIFPVFYTYILVIIILTYNHLINIDFRNLFFVGFHIWNYKAALSDIPLSIDIWYIGHFWTLALEEQFYLVWPFILWAFDTKKITKILPLILLLFPIIRFSSYFVFPDLRGQIGMMFHTMSDCILWGSYAALLLQLKTEYLIKKMKTINNIALSLILLYLFIGSPWLSTVFKGAYSITIGLTLEAICICALMLYLVNFKPKEFDFLNNKYFVYIGTLSYSLYIWQQLFLATSENSIHFSFPLNFILCFVTAYISYNTVERLGLYIKSKMK